MTSSAVAVAWMLALTVALTAGASADARRLSTRAAVGTRVVVTLFHETHTHGQLAGTPDDRFNVEFSRYVGLLNALRSRLAEPSHSLFLGNGDDISSRLNGVETKGWHTINAFNAADLDADTFGFNELHVLSERRGGARFPRDLAQLRKLVAGSRFAWVSANVREGATPAQVFAYRQGARKWVLRQVGGVMVGITGLIGTPAHPRAAPRPIDAYLRILDPVAALAAVIPKMRAAGAEVVVLLSHMSAAQTWRVLRAVKGIDVAVGTHDGPATPQPAIVNGAIVAVAGPYDLQALGRLDLTVQGGHVIRHSFRRFRVPASTEPDPDVESALAPYR